ncbi:MAG: STAS/SEC14 domain-containing protein [Bradymonadaceae bacterium]
MKEELVLEVLEETVEGLVVIRIGGTLDGEDYQVLRSRLAAEIEQSEGLRWYIEMDGFDSWGPDRFWNEVGSEASGSTCPPLVKVAVVGNKRWEDWIGRVWKWLDAVYPRDPDAIKFFRLDRRTEARDWVIEE